MLHFYHGHSGIIGSRAGALTEISSGRTTGDLIHRPLRDDPVGA